MVTKDFEKKQICKLDYLNRASTEYDDNAIEQFTCNFCTFTTNNINSARYHNLQRHRAEGKFQIFTTKQKVYDCDNAVEQFTCNFCTFTTNNINSARYHHLQRHRAEGNFQIFTTKQKVYDCDNVV